MPEELSTLNELHYKVNSHIVLKDELHVHYKRMINLEEDVFLQLDVLKLLIFNDYILADTFHGINKLGMHVLHKIHLSKGALAYHTHYYKILEARLAVS